MNIFKNIQKEHVYLVAIWFVFNIVQSFFTGLHSDESYYWMYSQNMDWGFFDHPPMAAFLIQLGYALFQNELGVRLFFIILSAITITIIVNELNENNDFLFLSLFVLSFPLMHTHIGGFLALPDIPLVFFTVLFFIFYKKFIAKPNFKIALILSVIVAAMIYSKYHSVLIIFFTLISNFKLFKNKYFWLIVIGSALILLPHVWWQYQNDFPTLRYHLYERAKPLTLKFVMPYIFGQIAIMGPLTGVIVLWKLKKIKIETEFDKAIIFSILGFFGIFFILSFYNRIEGHWTAAITPLIMLATYPLISKDPVSKKWFKRLSLPIIILFFLFRAYLAIDAIPNIGNLKITFYNREENAKEIQQMANGKKVGFFNNYAATSNYIFYTGEQAVMLSEPGYRFCQYDLWNDEAYAEGDSLFIIAPRHMDTTNIIRFADGHRKTTIVTGEFQSLKGLNLTINSIKRENKNLVIEILLQNKTNRVIQLKHTSSPSIICKQSGNELKNIQLLNIVDKNRITPNESVSILLNIDASNLDTKTPIIIYTKTKENNRGEIIAISPKLIP